MHSPPNLSLKKHNGGSMLLVAVRRSIYRVTLKVNRKEFVALRVTSRRQALKSYRRYHLLSKILINLPFINDFFLTMKVNGKDKKMEFQFRKSHALVRLVNFQPAS